MLRIILTSVALLFLGYGSSALANDSVICLQKELNDRGYDAGSIDGAIGKKTKSAAITAALGYQLALLSLDETNAAQWCTAISNLPPLVGRAVEVGDAPPGILEGLGTMVRVPWTNARPWGMRMAEDPLSPGNDVLRVELRYGDCGADPYSKRSDCTYNNERTEMSMVGTRLREGMKGKYGWRVLFPEDFKTFSRWTDVVVGQFHYYDPAPSCCAFMFIYNLQGLTIRRMPDAGAGGRGTNDIIIPRDEVRGKWHEISIEATWSKSDKGSFKVWVDGDQRYDYSGPTLMNDAYMKIGMYRLQTLPSEPPLTLYLDDIYSR